MFFAAPPTPPAAIRIDDTIAGLEARPDGSLLMPAFGVDSQPQVDRLGPSGKFVPPLPLPAAGVDPEDDAVPLLTGDGGAAILTKSASDGRMTFAQIDASGATVVDTQTIPGLERTTATYSPAVSPTGAVAVIAWAAGTTGWVPSLALRPAGGSFGAASPIGPAVSPLTLATQPRAIYTAAFGADGSGVILTRIDQTGALSLQRFSRAGVVGPSIPITFKHYAQVQARVVVGADGTAVVAIGTVGTLRHGHGRNELYVTSLAPGAAAVGPVRDLGQLRAAAVESESIDLAIDAGGHVVITGAVRPKGLGVFEGAPASIRRTQVVGVDQPGSAVQVPSADGGLTLLWERVRLTSGPAEAVMAAHRAPGGRFGRVRRVSKTSSNLMVPFAGVALPNGDVAFAYQRDGLYDYVSRFTP